MAKIRISKGLVDAIANQDNSKFVKSINGKVNDLLSLGVERLSQNISYISLENTILQPANELLNNSFVDNSTFVYLLGVQNVQLELNTIRKVSLWERFKILCKKLWDNRKYFKRRKKRRKKEDLEVFNFDPSKYNIYNLTEDLQKSLINFLTETSIVYMKDNVLEIVGKEDLGANVKIRIYVTSYSENVFKYYFGKKRAYINIDIEKRYKAIKTKTKEAGKNFVKIMKVFNSLYYNINGVMPNQMFLESVLITCPNELFKGDDLYNAFLKVVNYVSVKTIKEVKSINDANKFIYEDITCGDSAMGFNKLLGYLYLNDNEVKK